MYGVISCCVMLCPDMAIEWRLWKLKLSCVFWFSSCYCRRDGLVGFKIETGNMLYRDVGDVNSVGKNAVLCVRWAMSLADRVESSASFKDLYSCGF